MFIKDWYELNNIDINLNLYINSYIDWCFKFIETFLGGLTEV